MHTRWLGLCALVVAGGAVFVASACSSDTRPGFVEPSEAGGDAAADAGIPTSNCVPGTGATQTVTIGAAGGTIALDALTLTIPAGALDGDTSISVTSSQNCPWPADGFSPVTPMYAFAPEGLEFAQPVTIAIGYPGDHHAAIFAFTNDRGDLGDVPADNTSSTLSAQVSHLGSAVVGNYEQAIISPSQAAFLAAVPSSIDPGAHVTLDIDSNENFFTSDCSLDNGLGPVAFKQRLSPQQTIIPYAKYDVAPTTTTTYTLLCPTEKLNVVQTVVVNSPPLLTFTADKTTVSAGDVVTLTWAAGQTTFDACTLNGQAVATFGGTAQLTATPLSAAATDALFTLQCFDQGKHVLERRVKVTVNNTTTCIAEGDVCDPNALDDGCCAPTNCDATQKLCIVPTDGGAPDSGTPDSGAPDSGTPDSGTPDAGTDAGDAGDDAGSDAGDSGITDAGGDADAE